MSKEELGQGMGRVRSRALRGLQVKVWRKVR